MTVTLPTGWTTFAGGSTDPTLCDGGAPGLTATPELACVLNQAEITLEVAGGTPPFTWSASAGTLTVTGTRTATLSIEPAEDVSSHAAKVARIAYFKPFTIYIASITDSEVQRCYSVFPPNNFGADITTDTWLQAYDCLKREIHFNGQGGIMDHITPDWDDPSPGDELTNPIGDVVADRFCFVTQNWASTITSNPSINPDDPLHWSAGDSGCQPTINFGTVSLSVGVTVAGKNGPNGTIWSGAPSTSETHPITQYDVITDQTGSTFNLVYTQYIDVRTQAMVDADCCTVPDGGTITITVTDVLGEIATIILTV